MRDMRVLALRVIYGCPHYSDVFQIILKFGPIYYNEVFIDLLKISKVPLPEAVKIAGHIHHHKEEQLSFDIRGPWAVRNELKEINV